MQMKSKFKSEKGIMTMYVTVAVVTFTIILTAVFSLAVATRKNQIKTLIKIKEVYEQSNDQKEKIYMAQKEKVELPSTLDTTPYYPDNTFRKDTSTDLNTGLIIKDTSDNEYVWIEVPKSLYDNEAYNTETTTADQKPASSEDYDKIEYCLHKYTADYRNGTSYSDTYYSDETTGLTETKYNELKQKMLKSVYENGGFWIGRYEAGITENRRASGTPTIAPISKPGTVDAPVYTYNYVTCSQAQTLASQLSTEKKYTSSLMFGVQWDLVLKHIETKEVENGITLETIQSALKSDSKDWGNYGNATFTINRGMYCKSAIWYNYNIALENCVTYVNEISTKLNSNSILLTTGASDACKKMNIYDLAGNVYEWTLEYTANSNTPCVGRGGGYYHTGSKYSVYCRIARNPTNNSSDFGFRISLYK